MNTFETERLLFRAFTIEDAAAVLAFNSCTQVTRYTGDAGVVSSLSDARRVITEVWHKDYSKYGYGRLAVVDKAKQKVIGFAGLKYLPEHGEADLGYRFLPEYWGQGLGFEAARACVEQAFSEYHLEKILGLVMADNHGSKRILEKLGFNESGKVIEDSAEFIAMTLNASDWRKS